MHLVRVGNFDGSFIGIIGEFLLALKKVIQIENYFVNNLNGSLDDSNDLKKSKSDGALVVRSVGRILGGEKGDLNGDSLG